jgi:tetratricopeptide (TPR) repeat protein
MPPPVAVGDNTDLTRAPFADAEPTTLAAQAADLAIGDRTSPGLGIGIGTRARTEPDAPSVRTSPHVIARAPTTSPGVAPPLVPPRGRPDTQRRLGRMQTDVEATRPPPSPAPATPRRLTPRPAPPPAPAPARPDPRAMRSPLVGRTAVMAQLRSVVARAAALGQPQLVTIVGNQGTGKSRLLAEFAAEQVGTRARVVSGRARVGDAPGSVVASLLRDRFDLAGLDEPAARQRLRTGVSELLGDGELLHYLGGMVGLHFDASQLARALDDDPRQRGDVQRAVLRRLVQVDATAAPLVIVVDDLHLADDWAVATLGGLPGSVGGAPLVLVAATRPELLVRGAGWPSAGERIELRNLDPDDAEAMLRGLLASCDGVTDGFCELAVQQTGGNPTFLEQLVRLLIDQGAIDVRAPRWRLHEAKAATVQLPISIEEAVEARIAELERPERALLEQAAVFGNVFWLSALVTMTRADQAERGAARPAMLGDGAIDPAERAWGEHEPTRAQLRALLAELAERDYVLVLDAEDSTFPGDVEVVFKHNLEREFIVRATEPERLRRHHLLAAQWLEARIAGRSAVPDDQLEFLAALYERGGDGHRALQAHLDAGRRARGRDALADARQSYERALALIDGGGADGARAPDRHAPMRMELLHDLGDVLDKAGHRELAEARFGELLELAWRFDHQAKAGAAYTRLARLRRRAGRLGQALEYLHRAEALYDAARDDRGIGAVLDELGRVHALRGELDVALDHHQQALAIRRTVGDPRSIALSLAQVGRTLHDVGDLAAALPPLAEALATRRSIGDRLGVAQSLIDLADTALEAGDAAAAAAHAREARVEAEAIGNRGALAEALQRLGAAFSRRGDHELALATLAEARAIVDEVGDRGGVALTARRRAEALQAAGQLDAAWTSAQEAVAIGEATGAKLTAAIARRISAEVAIARGDLPSAERELTRAAEVLRGLGHGVELGRTYLVLAALRERLGDVGGAAEWRTRAAAASTRRPSQSGPR